MKTGSQTYLDWNATAPVKPAVIARMMQVLATAGNPSSVHGFGRAARRALEDARSQVAQAVGARPDGVVFTASGTEANNLALTGWPDRRRVVSAIEHESAAARDATVVPVTEQGVVDLDAAARIIAALEAPFLLSVMLANNEIGTLQPVRELADLAHAKGGLVHCDAVQGIGRLPVTLDELGIDMMTVAGHKAGGPLGAAALVLSAGLDPAPLLRGGGQERGRRAGTENVAAIAGFGLALSLLDDDLAGMGQIAARRDRLERALLGGVPEAAIIGGAVPRLPNTSSIALPGVSAETQVMALDLAGFAVSAGSACSSGKVKASRVLAAMGLAPDMIGSAIRVSIGPATTDAEIDAFAQAWIAMAQRLAKKVA